ncbi:MAG: FUSC family protein [Actinomycetota bacterium]|nr:FUSC family protein [Actinomycetota bacterium]
MQRLRARGWQIGQCAVAAAVAWLAAAELLGHPRPFLAPVAAIVSLGVSYGQRLRRVAEVTVGVSVGVGVADLFIHWAGTGLWQIAVIVAVSMTTAVLLDAGNLLVNQAAVQSVIVAILLPNPEAGLSRWLDALVGGAVALVAATVVPRAPLRRPREQAARIVRTLGRLLRAAVDSVEEHDVDDAVRTLEDARDTETALDDLRTAAREGLDVVRSSPLRRRHRPAVRKMADLVVPLDRAMRNTRVLVRRTVAATRDGEAVPGDYLALVDRVADATDLIAAEFAAGRLPVAAREPLADIAQQTAIQTLRGGLSAAVVLAQVRSLVVDLLQLTGLSAEEARELMPTAPGPAASDPPPD